MKVSTISAMRSPPIDRKVLPETLDRNNANITSAPSPIRIAAPFELPLPPLAVAVAA